MEITHSRVHYIIVVRMIRLVRKSKTKTDVVIGKMQRSSMDNQYENVNLVDFDVVKSTQFHRCSSAWGTCLSCNLLFKLYM